MSQKLIHIQTALLAVIALMIGLHLQRHWTRHAAPEFQYKAIRPEFLPGGFDPIVTVIHYRTGEHPREGFSYSARSPGEVLEWIGKEGWQLDGTLRDGTLLVRRQKPQDPQAMTDFKLEGMKADPAKK